MLFSEELYENFDENYTCERSRNGTHHFHVLAFEEAVYGVAFASEADAKEFKSKMQVMAPKPKYKLHQRFDILREAAVYRLTWYAILIALAWFGYALEAAALWWLPHHLGYTYIQYYLSWAPHHPADETARYRTTRSFRAAAGNLLSLGMQYHIVHHLHPRIPLYRTPQAYWELKPILERRGANVQDL